MSWHDWMSVGRGALDTTINGANALASDLAPGGGPMSAASDALGEASASIYDYRHGDRDGAIGHGAQAVMHAGSLLPGAGTVLTGADMAVGMVGTGARLNTAIANSIAGETLLDPDEIPTSAGDLMSQVAVGATHAIHGPQQSRGTGTERGENSSNPGLIPAVGVGGVIGPALAARSGGSNEPGSTSGNNRTLGSRAGDWIHERLNGAPVRNRAQH
jgi:hypothetical protein